MKTPAQKHAHSLEAKYGRSKARELAKAKMQDAPFLVNGDRNFWFAVLEALRS